MHTIKKNTKSLLIASKEIGLEVNAEKPMPMSHKQNGGQYHNINFSNKKFKHGTFQIFGNNSNKSTQHS